jgi:hypothetical protein
MNHRHLVPLLQVVRGIDQCALFIRKHHHHDPALGWLMPEHVGITEISHLQVEHGIAGVLLPASPSIAAEAEALGLERCWVQLRTGVDRHQRVLAKPGRALRIVNCRTGEDHELIVLKQRRGAFSPVRQIRADGVTPAHMAPVLAVGVVLIKQVPQPAMMDEAVGVAQPVRSWRIVIVRAHDWLNLR